MGEYSEVFVAFDVAKKKHAVAIAEGGRTGEVRFLGEVENSPLPIERTIKRLADRYDRLHVCFEAGPTGYGLYRQIQAIGHDCMVVAPTLIPKRADERVKTNRRDAVTLARVSTTLSWRAWKSAPRCAPQPHYRFQSLRRPIRSAYAKSRRTSVAIRSASGR
jgi:transposase